MDNKEEIREERIKELALKFDKITRDYTYPEILEALAIYFLAIASALDKDVGQKIETGLSLEDITASKAGSFQGYLVSIANSFINVCETIYRIEGKEI